MSSPTGEELKQQGMQLALDNAEKSSPGWGDLAICYLRMFPKKTFLAEEVRNWSHNNGLAIPPNARAWGGVMVRAKKRGFIKFIGYKSVNNPKAHRTPASYWEKLID